MRRMFRSTASISVSSNGDMVPLFYVCMYVHTRRMHFLLSRTGMYKEEKELCLDCRSQAAGHTMQQCRLNGHEANIVIYSDTERKEIVPVYWSAIASKLNVKFTVEEDHLRTCHDCTECSFPHHYLEARILNIWRENTVMTNTRPSSVRVPDSLKF